MIKPLVASCSLALAACSLGLPVAQAVDGAPVEGALTTVIQEYQEVPIERLSDLGVEAYALDALDGEYAFYFSFSPELSAAIKDGDAAVHFSLWTIDGAFILGIPPVSDNGKPFWMMEGHVMRIMMETKSKYRGLKPGTGYYAMFDPKGHLREP